MNFEGHHHKRNWGNMVEYSSDVCLYPETVHDVQTIVKDKRYQSLKVIGTRHCFNTVADTRKFAPGTKTGIAAHISVEKLKSFVFEKIVIKGEEEKGPQPVVTVGAGAILKELMDAVEEAGYAIE